MKAAMSPADQKMVTTPTAIHQHMRNDQQIYIMPSEDELHEGTWLQWPHNNGWDRHHVQRYEESWIQMAQALHKGERVHVIVYNARHMRRVRCLLRHRGLDMSKLDFWIQPTDDVWIRDNGPIFVRDEENGGNLLIENYGFNGWGGKADYWKDNMVPIRVAQGLELPRLDIPMVNEGGSFEVDGKGTLMAKKSSILNPNRNPGMTQADAEAIFCKYLGVTNFIWLEGERDIDVTDDHVDGTARFAGNNTIVTLCPDDFANPSEYDVLVKACNANGEPYTIVHLPTTSKTILNSGVEGIYVNYYVGNDVVLVPTYNDPMDQEAIRILGQVYPSRRVVGINMEQVHVDGGAVHCVTQQQPAAMMR
jgi:agmatine deiminase